MKLLADATLGRLAKWLRILGYDTAYCPDTDDLAVVRLSRAEDRLILTRDRALAKRRGVRAMLIESEVVEDQLGQVVSALGPPPDLTPVRCPICNQALAEATSQQVAAGVPRFVQETHSQFSYCRVCERIYWRGTHWQRMQTRIARLRYDKGSDTIGAETKRNGK